MAGSPLDAAMSAGSSIGRYFSIVVLIPATLFVLYVAGLVAAGAVTGPFQPGALPAVVTSWGLSGIAWLTVAAVLAGLCLHPLTFVFTQILEGYWGTSVLALKLTEQQVRRHRRKVFRLGRMKTESRRELWFPASVPPAADQEERARLTTEHRLNMTHLLRREEGDVHLAALLRESAANKTIRSYPTRHDRILPTMLGNTLRRMEDSAGKPFGLDALVVAPHLAMVAAPRPQAVVSSAREAMDLMVNLVVVGGAATVATLVLLADDGFWVAFGLVPFGLAWISYLGAVSAAREFGATFAAMLALARFDLYDALRLPQPETTTEEVTRGPAVLDLLTVSEKPAARLRPVRLEHPGPHAPAEGPAD